MQSIDEMIDGFGEESTVNSHNEQPNTDQPITIQSIDELIDRFGKETTLNPQTDPTIIASTLLDSTSQPITPANDTNNQQSAVCRTNGLSVLFKI